MCNARIHGQMQRSHCAAIVYTSCKGRVKICEEQLI